MRYLWHVQVFWWGRIGTLLQLLGAMTVIATIIGPERIRAFTSNLHDHGLRQAARRVRWTGEKLWKKYKGALTSGQGISLVGLLTGLGTIVALVVVCGGLLLGVLHVKGAAGVFDVVNEITVGVIVAISAVPLVVLLSMMIVSGLAYALELLVQRPLELVANNSALDAPGRASGPPGSRSPCRSTATAVSHLAAPAEALSLTGVVAHSADRHRSRWSRIAPRSVWRQ